MDFLIGEEANAASKRKTHQISYMLRSGQIEDWEGVEKFCLQYPSQRYEKYSTRAKLKRINKRARIHIQSYYAIRKKP